ncbi:hypothetical protein A9G44_06370 [Gilliamella sp. Occ4-3]|nr:hypothetical protein A9G44_06370 [Gilliamella apicola]
MGAKIIERLEKMNFDSFDKLCNASLDEILNKSTLLSGSTLEKQTSSKNGNNSYFEFNNT